MFTHEWTQPTRRRPDRLSPRRIQLSRIAAVVAIVALGATPRPAAAQNPTVQKASNIVYVESNDPGGNAIFAFSRGGDGSLTALAGSPFPAGGLGITPTFALGPFDSDQEVIVNPQGTMLFASTAGPTRSRSSGSTTTARSLRSTVRRFRPEARIR